jgi:cytidine deaminase
MPVKRDVSFTFDEYTKQEDLGNEDSELISAARDAALKAYAPYSGFFVGAALRLESGKIVCGANVENAAYPSGVCAERNALAHAITSYPDDQVNTIAIVASTEKGLTEAPASPCGMCRQVIAEEEFRTGKKIRIILSCKTSTWVIKSISELLPLQFSRDNLGINLP